MLLVKVAIKYLGPFCEETEVCFESDVTVLTGQNDTGKTSVLNVVERLCRFQKQESIRESEVNVERFGQITTPWEKDSEISCYALFRATGLSTRHFNGQLAPGDELDAVFHFAPQAKSVSSYRFRKQGQGVWSKGGSVSIKRLPLAIRLPAVEPIRPVIDLASPNPAELCFLQAAFGPQYSWENFAKISDYQFSQLLSKAKGDMNRRLRSVLPPSMDLEFDFQEMKGDRQHLSIHLRDQFSGHTSLGVRGAGVQRLASIVGGLFSHDLTSEHAVVLFDEPENSLHADAQHTLRALLEGLAEGENLQVIYATHSPSMINTFRPASLRVFQQTAENGRATCQVLSRPIDANYFAVRSSLGITPADSLLFAPVTLIVEGPSDALGVSILLRRFEKEGIDGFSDVSRILSECHIIEGSGDSFEYLCRLAKSNGAKPVVFLDGDKRGSRLEKIRAKHPDVPVLLLDEGQELEDILPREAYFDALRKVFSEYVDVPDGRFSATSFEAWNASAELPEKMVFTKRVRRWLEDEFDLVNVPENKPAVMKEAASLVDPRVVKAATLGHLVAELRRLLRDSATIPAATTEFDLVL